VIWPSVWPLDHGNVIAPLMAASSLVTPLANDATRLALAPRGAAGSSRCRGAALPLWRRSMWPALERHSDRSCLCAPTEPLAHGARRHKRREGSR
jgi:hypothetical protein